MIEKFGPYQITRELGRGAGVLWFAFTSARPTRYRLAEPLRRHAESLGERS